MFLKLCFRSEYQNDLKIYKKIYFKQKNNIHDLNSYGITQVICDSNIIYVVLN